MPVQLTQPEQLAARMFTNVSVQSAFSLEDPNVRFIAEFKYEPGVGTQGATKVEDVPHKTYSTEVDGIQIVLETNPPGNPALSRVLVDKGRAPVMIDALREAYDTVEHFEYGGEAVLPLADGAVAIPGMTNRMIRLVINTDLFKAEHDIAVLVSWIENDESQQQVELAAWPIAKQAVGMPAMS